EPAFDEVGAPSVSISLTPLEVNHEAGCPGPPERRAGARAEPAPRATCSRRTGVSGAPPAGGGGPPGRASSPAKPGGVAPRSGLNPKGLAARSLGGAYAVLDVS